MNATRESHLKHSKAAKTKLRERNMDFLLMTYLFIYLQLIELFYKLDQCDQNQFIIKCNQLETRDEVNTH